MFAVLNFDRIWGLLDLIASSASLHYHHVQLIVQVKNDKIPALIEPLVIRLRP